MKRLLTILLFSAFYLNAHCADLRLATVEEDGNGDYTTLLACEAGEDDNGNLVGDGVYLDVKICGTDLGGDGWDAPDSTARILWTGWTTGPDNYIRIYTTDSARHSGYWETGKYILDPTSATQNILYYEDYMRFEGLQMDDTEGGANCIQYAGGSSIDIRVSYCIFQSAICLSNATGGTFKVYNSLTFNLNDNDCANVNQTFYFYNYTTAGRMICRDNTTTNIYNGIITYADAFLTYANTTLNVNYSSWSENDDGTGDIDSGGNNRYNQSYSFEDSGSGDYRLKSDDTGALDFGGSDTSGLGISYTDDLGGDTRSGSWDIGADEYVGGAPASYLGQIIFM